MTSSATTQAEKATRVRMRLRREKASAAVSTRLVAWACTQGDTGDTSRATAAKIVTVVEHMLGLATRQRAELELLRDREKRLLIFDGGPELMSWAQAHRIHERASEPYIGCPFCRERFELKPVEHGDSKRKQIDRELEQIDRELEEVKRKCEAQRVEVIALHKATTAQENAALRREAAAYRAVLSGIVYRLDHDGLDDAALRTLVCNALTLRGLKARQREQINQAHDLNPSDEKARIDG